MYSLDVNFLKDRHIETARSKKSSKTSFSTLNDRLPLILGASALLLLPALAGSLWLFLNYESGKTQGNIQALDSQLNSLKAQNQRLSELENQIKGVEGELNSLVGVFDQIKPWSALLGEVSRQIPATVAIDSITQDNRSLILTGQAMDYGSLNDFLLNLQNSKFLKSEQTQLVSANLKEMATPLTKPSANIQVTFPRIVSFSLKTELSDIPSSDLQPDLKNNGAVGLVTRIQSLKQKGVVKP
jgi:type IV pilus assembly protein PilN